MKAPYKGIADQDYRDHPQLPWQSHGDQDQHHTKRRNDAGQKQMDTRLSFCPHYSSNSNADATRLSSSFGKNGFFK